MNLGFCLGFANNLNFCYLFVSDAEYNEELQQRPGLTRKGNFPACPQEVLEGRCSFLGIWLLPWSSSLPQHSGEPTSTRCCSVCASPCAWESPEGDGEQRGRALTGTLSTGFSGFSCNPLPKFPPSPSLRQRTLVCLLGYHHEKKGFRL